MAGTFKIGTLVRNKKTEQTGVITKDIHGVCSNDEVAVRYDLEPCYEKVNIKLLDVLGMEFERGTPVRNKKTGQIGVVDSDIWHVCTSDETPVIYDGKTHYTGTITQDLEAID
jgi:hypothetical protein